MVRTKLCFLPKISAVDLAPCLLPKISGVEVTPSVTSVESSEQFWRKIRQIWSICEPWVNKLMSCLITEFLWIFSYKLHGIISNSMDTLSHSMKLHWYFREPHGIPWNSTMFPGIPWTSKETPWNFMAVHGTPSLFHGTPRNSMAFHGTTWILHGTPFHSMELHGYSMELHGIPWNSMGTPWMISMDFHGFP